MLCRTLASHSKQDKQLPKLQTWSRRTYIAALYKGVLLFSFKVSSEEPPSEGLTPESERSNAVKPCDVLWELLLTEPEEGKALQLSCCNGRRAAGPASPQPSSAPMHPAISLSALSLLSLKIFGHLGA